jgi:hypothetical protein
MSHTMSSTTPLLLVHLPESPPTDGIQVESAFWNLPLYAPGGVLDGVLDLRREILPTSGQHATTGDPNVLARVTLWHQGKRFTGIA